jgi:6-phosphogluconate dehydrogenase
MSRIAFIGLGNMGGPMAANLLKAGHTLHVFDLSADAVAQAVSHGATAAETAVGAVEDAEIVISMLPASRHVEGLYLGETGLLRHIADGALVIDCSTIAPASAQKVAKAAGERGLTMIDAPVSGGTAGAAAGTPPSSWVATAMRWNVHARYWPIWARIFSTSAAAVRARWPSCATTWRSASSWPSPARRSRWASHTGWTPPCCRR